MSFATMKLEETVSVAVAKYFVMKSFLLNN